MKHPALITTEVLAWARRSAGLTIPDAAAALRIKARLVREWEQGRQISLRDLNRLAKLYHRPLAVFYLPKPPYDFRVARDTTFDRSTRTMP